MPLRAALLCPNKNCKPMFLPDAEQPHPEQSAWPADGALRSFLCPTCKEQRSFSVRDVQQENEYPLEKRQNVIHIAVRCRDKNCNSQFEPKPRDRKTKGLIETRTFLPFDARDRVREEALRIFTQFAHITAQEIKCDNRHKLDLRRYQPEAHDAVGYDEAWKSPEKDLEKALRKER
jgi:hypothetical protein